MYDHSIHLAFSSQPLDHIVVRAYIPYNYVFYINTMTISAYGCQKYEW